MDVKCNKHPAEVPVVRNYKWERFSVLQESSSVLGCLFWKAKESSMKFVLTLCLAPCKALNIHHIIYPSQ